MFTILLFFNMAEMPNLPAEYKTPVSMPPTMQALHPGLPSARKRNKTTNHVITTITPASSLQIPLKYFPAVGHTLFIWSPANTPTLSMKIEARNNNPVSKMTMNALALELRLNKMPGLSAILMFQISFRLFLMTVKSVVAMNIKNKNPPIATYGSDAALRIPRIVARICIEPSCPNVATSTSRISPPNSFSPRKRLKIWKRMITIGGNAKLVKKAVAPANLSGSFLFNTLNAPVTIPITPGRTPGSASTELF